MTGKQAKILSDEQVEHLLFFVSTTRHFIRNRVLVLLSLKAGLRAGEIAKLTWPMVLGPQNEIAAAIARRDEADELLPCTPISATP
jgi:integrase